MSRTPWLDRFLDWPLTQYATWFLALIPLTLALGTVMAPLAAAAEYRGLAEPLYHWLHACCHQMPSRSLFLLGHSMGLCSRCFVLYLSFGLALLVVPRRQESLERFPDVPLWLVIALAVPLGVDGGTQLLGWRESTNLLRVLTGAAFGVPAGMYVGGAVNRALLQRRVARQPRLG
jgi:uncharacterized membrane protein